VKRDLKADCSSGEGRGLLSFNLIAGEENQLTDFAGGVIMTGGGGEWKRYLSTMREKENLGRASLPKVDAEKCHEKH